MRCPAQATVVAASLAAWLLTFPGVARAEPPRGQAARALGPVQVDGALDEAAWQQASWQGGFTDASTSAENSGQPRPAAVQTRFKTLFDDHTLYVAVECDEPNPEGIRAAVAEHDGMVFTDDCIEIFLDPEGAGRYYHHFVVNTRGAWYDDYCADYGLVHGKLWDCPIRAAGRVDAPGKRWTAEVAIPFGALTLGEKAGGTWAWNVTRERYAGRKHELTSWSPLKGNFHAPRLFGRLEGVRVDFRRFAFALAEPSASIAGGGSGIRQLQLRTRVANNTPSARTVVPAVSLFGKAESAVRVAPVALAPGKEAAVTFPPLAVRDSISEVVCLLTLSDAGSDALVKAAAKRLSAEYRPVALEIREPCYRNTIYATQKLVNVVFRVALAPEVAGRAVALRWELRAGTGAVLRRGRQPAPGRPVDVAFPAAGLAVGKYRLVAVALAADGKALGRAEAPLRKLPPPDGGAEVRIDANRSVLVNGKPFVGIGWYGSVPVEDPRRDVVALQSVQTPVVVMMPDTSGIREAFEKHGIYSIVSVENGRLFYSFELWKQQGSTIQSELTQLSEPSAEMRRLVHELVDKVRGEPGVLGYYIADEPEINNARSDYLEALYRLLQEEDPYHPVMVTNDTLDGIVTHGYRCADILNPDPYSPSFDYVPNFLKKVLEVGRRGKATMLTPWHASSQAHFTDEYGTAPPYPYRVFRNQYLAGVAYGAVGFTGYASDFFLPEVEYRYGLPYVWREIRFLERAMGAPASAEPLRVQASAEMARWIRRADGHLTIIVANHKPGARQARVSHPLLRPVARLFVLSEGRQVAVKAGSFTDRFAEGDVHVYTTDPRAKAYKTTTAVQAELAQRAKADARPGNLLHWTRGTRVLASEGFFAPWFFQYPYYAVNGITDDLGWSAYAWGEKPAWLEVVLKQPAPIGRLVLHTPNLKDYTVDLRGPDSAVSRVTVQGNTENLIEHTFQPPIQCLKVRLTVSAVRPAECRNGNTPLVREIEAYSEPGTGPATPVTQVSAPVALPEQGAAPGAEAGPNALWSDDFRDFRTADRYYGNDQDTKWVLKADQFRAQAKPDGGVSVACLSPTGGNMTHLFPYDPEHRFFQAKLSAIAGEGYRFAHVGFAVSSGGAGYRGAINTARPGIYTVDTHFIHPDFREGRNRQCFINVFTAGAQKGDDGSVAPGPEFTFEWLRLVRQPEDGLAVTLADGSPLPPALKEGDELLFRLYLGAPAADATVEARKSHEYSPLAINGEPYVQLAKTGAGDGREWAGRVKLGPGTGKFDLAKSGYPVVFRAAITGGAIKETYASAFVSFE